jgi:hypothetical protein
MKSMNPAIIELLKNDKYTHHDGINPPSRYNYMEMQNNEQNGNIAILVNYPNCKNYEGEKIIVFKNTTWEQVKNLKELDPHFTEENVVKPFARFEPTEEGWLSAVALLNAL